MKKEQKTNKLFLLLKCLAFIVAAVYAWDLMAAWGWPLWLAIPGEGMVAGLFFSHNFRAACAEEMLRARDPVYPRKQDPEQDLIGHSRSGTGVGIGQSISTPHFPSIWGYGNWE